MKTVSAVTAGALLGAFTSASYAQEIIEPVVVTATRAEFRDTEAPYASEVHTREAIKQSGATSLYDYLDRNTSLSVMPNYGNPFAQLLDMRGYGIGSGYQNIAITLDGRRLNNIDLGPQLLSAIPLSSIERIEIIKGSGTVMNGDGATAGAINIITRDADGVALGIAAGSHGISTTTASAGLAGDYAALTILAENYRQDGFRDADPSGTHDEADSNSTRALLRLYPTDSTELRIGKELAWINTTYGDYLTKTQFDANPAQYGGNGWSPNYTAQKFDTDVTTAGITAALTPQIKLVLDHAQEDKKSSYVGFTPYTYDHASYDLALHYEGGTWNLIAGGQLFDGTRSQSGDNTSKENHAYFLQYHYRQESTRYSAGVRSERVSYSHAPAAGATLKDHHDLSAYDIGINHRLSEQLSLFANYSDAYQAPDIDRFFTTDFFTLITSFNTFIEPAHSRTWNLGLNHVTATNKLKLTLFHASLEDEIFYYSSGPWSGYNTNIDKSHKYGIELQESHIFSDRLSATLNYSYTHAVIDSENEGGGAYDGSDLPGVSPHTLNAALNYSTAPGATLSISHSYRSEAYAANDFANDFSQKQRAYHSTGIGYRQQVQEFELFAHVDNLFSHANGLWIEDDVIYPVNFERTWRIGIKAKL